MTFKSLKIIAVTLALLAAGSCGKKDNGGQIDPARPVVPDVQGMTVRGAVLCQGVGVPSVVVSDGYEVTQTDKDGFFWLNSKKQKGYVFITVPSGYMSVCDGALPRFWQRVTTNAAKTSPLYFDLEKEDNSSFDLVVSTDFHLADRYQSKDLNTFKNTYIPALKEVAASGRPTYNIVLGDMTWDIYWDQFNLAKYKTMARQFPVKTFHVIGNHDYDMDFQEDFKAEQKYVTSFGPTYYSFELGENHFIVLDDIVYKNPDRSRDHDTYVSDEQIAWLKKDLALVPMDKRIFVAMHCTAFRIGSITSAGKPGVSLAFSPAAKEVAFLECFKGRETHFLTGDTHLNQSIPPECTPMDSEYNIYEHNVAAVCSSWWWTTYLSENHICKDGSEGGFLVMSADGTDLKWQYRSFAYKFDKQFHCYDMNKVKDYINTDPSFAALYFAYPSRERYTSIGSNVVLVNVWNWDPRWQVKVTENGNELPVTWLSIEDPLHTLSYDAPRTADNGELTSSFRTIKSEHLFTVKTSSPSSKLEIEVKDSFGNVCHQTMDRPQDFSLQQL